MSNNPFDELMRQQAVIRDRVRGVALGHYPGLYLFGRPGTSKTYTVRAALKALGVVYQYHTGHLTALGLFDLLAAHPDQIIVLDDVSALFGQPVAVQILLAALGQQSRASPGRLVKYQRRGSEQIVRFTGGIIAVSNLQLHDTPVLSALRSRVHVMNYDPTDEQLAAQIRYLLQRGWPPDNPQLSPTECREVADFVIAESMRLGRRLDLRVLFDKAIPDYLQHRAGESETHWRDLVLATLRESPDEFHHTPKPTRQRQKEIEHVIVQRIRLKEERTDEQLRAWREETGKSDRAYWRRLKENRRAAEGD